MCCSNNECVLYISFNVIWIIRSFFDSAIYWSICSPISKNHRDITQWERRAHLEGVIKVGHLAQVVQGLVDARLVVLDKGV